MEMEIKVMRRVVGREKVMRDIMLRVVRQSEVAREFASKSSVDELSFQDISQGSC